jgi:aminocarboxymuconate-semialdehyde decarboxylase
MQVVDMHDHMVAPEVIAFLAREGEHYSTQIVEYGGRRFFVIQESAMRPTEGPISDIHARITDMDREGVTMQAVSCVPFLTFPEVAPQLGLAIAQVNNEALAVVGANNPDRFVPVASVPKQDPALAAKELERAAMLGFRGVEIPPRIIERQLDEPEFEVFWEAAAALGMAVCVHPFEAAPRGAFARYFLGTLVGNLFDTGLAAALLIYGGVLERHPSLRIVLYHAGGTLPSIIGRLDMGYKLLPECRGAIPRLPSSYLEQFSFDTIALNPPMLRHLVGCYGAERFVVGTDHPLPARVAHPVQEIQALGLEREAENKILAANALDLLKLALPT